MRFVHRVKCIFFTTGYTTGYGLLVASVARFAIRLGGLVVKVPAACKVMSSNFESRVGYFVCLLHLTFNLTVLITFFVGRLGLVGLRFSIRVDVTV